MNNLSHRGFGTVEALVAIALLAIAASSLAQAIATSMASRRESADWVRATEIAVGISEQMRGGDFEIAELPEGFEGEAESQPLPDHPGVERFKVTVRWANDAHIYEVEGLLWRNL